jgi:hypothetical protein
MSNSQSKNTKSWLRKAIRPFIFAFIACGIFYYLFGSFGPIFKILNTDLSFLMLPFMGYYVLRLFSRLIGLAKPSRNLTACALILDGIAFSFFSYFFFHQTPLFAKVNNLDQYKWLFIEIQRLSIFSILFFAGLTVVRLSSLLKDTKWETRAYPAVLASGQIMMGIALWQSSAAFSQSWAPFKGIGLILFTGMLAVAISSAGNYGKKSRYPIIADISEWFKNGPTGKFFFGLLLAAYFIFLRPMIITATPWASIIEWLIVCIVSGIILFSIRMRLKDNYSLPVKESSWQAHVQEIDEFADEDLEKMVSLQQSFINLSSKGNLVELLQRILKENGLNEKEISNILAAISEYRDRKTPWFFFSFWKRRILRQNLKNRKQVLDNTIIKLESLIRPM